jgi:hypothetical protein
MAANNTKDWSDLLDVVLFEADRVNLQRRMEHATEGSTGEWKNCRKTNIRAASRNALHSATL